MDNLSDKNIVSAQGKTILEVVAEREMDIIVDIARSSDANTSVLIPSTVVAVYGIRLGNEESMLQTMKCSAVPSDGNLPNDDKIIVDIFSKIASTLYKATNALPQVILIISDANVATLGIKADSRDDAFEKARDVIGGFGGHVRDAPNSRECLIATAVSRTGKCMYAIKEYARSVFGESAGRIVFDKTVLSSQTNIEDEINVSRTALAAAIMFMHMSNALDYDIAANHPGADRDELNRLVFKATIERDITVATHKSPSYILIDADSGETREFG